jgi:hypothetical protein
MITSGSSTPPACLKMVSRPSDRVEVNGGRGCCKKKNGGRGGREVCGVACLLTEWEGSSTHRERRSRNGDVQTSVEFYFSVFSKKKTCYSVFALQPLPFSFFNVFHFALPFTLIAGHFFLRVYFSYAM